MFDVGMMEMFVVVVLAIIVVGPKDLPKLLRSLGRFVAKIRAMGQEFQNTLKQMSDEIELEEVTRKLNEAGNIPIDDLDSAPDILDTAPDILDTAHDILDTATDIKTDAEPETEVKPEGKAPKGKAPEGKAPEGKAPEGKAPEGKAPEGKAPEGKAPARRQSR
ncbi:MAG: twin-arginine translocase subunit TatB [Alphaproteobacteria bacterium]|nr:twin-arginine translocase subunit TatB [Alphaproteobacteria bacterium]